MNDKSLNKKIIKNSISSNEVFSQFDFSREDLTDIHEKQEYYEILMDIRKTRKEKGLTQEELSARSGVPRVTIAQIETGKRNATIETLQLIARAMGKKIIVKLV